MRSTLEHLRRKSPTPCLAHLDRAWSVEEALSLLQRRNMAERPKLLAWAERCADAVAAQYGAEAGEARLAYLRALIDDAGEGAKARTYAAFLEALGSPWKGEAKPAPAPESDEKEETWPEGPTDEELRALEAETLEP